MNAAVFTPVAMNPVTGVGAPSYTSGAHMWKGTTATLNMNPISSSASPRPAIGLSAGPRRRPMRVRLVSPVAP